METTKKPASEMLEDASYTLQRTYHGWLTAKKEAAEAEQALAKAKRQFSGALHQAKVNDHMLIISSYHRDQPSLLIKIDEETGEVLSITEATMTYVHIDELKKEDAAAVAAPKVHEPEAA
ncbi:hypothetical protein [Chitiniphilus eburneus]|uniref:hypothetical protein n=1 Tax=Chitiniphilus eburneus TaxID=2571148 RepID=UPI0035CEBB0A